MKKYILAAALASLCVACDKAPESPTVEKKETTVVNPPEKKDEAPAAPVETKEVVKEKEVTTPAPAPAPAAPEVKEEKKETTTTTETKPADAAPAAPAPASEPAK